VRAAATHPAASSVPADPPGGSGEIQEVPVGAQVRVEVGREPG
jgi:hypothetical protein